MCSEIRPGRFVLTEHLIDNLTVIWLLTYFAKWINKSLSHTALVGPMHHSCLASHLSSESTPLLGMGNVKPPPIFFFLSFICSLHHSRSLADLQFVKSLPYKNLQKSPAKSFQIMWTKWLMATMMWAQGKLLKKVMQTKPTWISAYRHISDADL